MSQKFPLMKSSPPAMRMALEALGYSPKVERVEIIDYDDSHVTFSAGRGFTWHRQHGIFELGSLSATLTEILPSLSEYAHFRMVHYGGGRYDCPAQSCERAVRE